MTRVVNPSSSAPVAEPVARRIVTPEGYSAQTIPSEDDKERYEAFLEARRRTSMSVPQMKMTVPDIPGYHTHWMNDDQGRIERSLRAGYQFVESDEVVMHDFSLAGDSTKTGNQDMGSRVSMVVGTKEGGAPARAYLMKIKIELWNADQKLQQEVNDNISRALRAGKIGTDGGDNAYVKTVEVSRRDQRAPASFGVKADI